MEEVKKVYSVWGIPSPDIQPRIKNIMDVLRTEFNAPYFDPHVTVVGAIELTEHDALKKFNEACNGVKAYNAVVEKVASGTFFYQCVFLLLKPSAEVKKMYSVWGIPSLDIQPRIKNIMDVLRTEFDAPYFHPHVTVVGAIELTEREAVKKFNEACNGVKAYEAVVEKVASYRCVFLLLESSAEVVDTSSHVCGHFGYKSSTPYMPHLSLLYQDLSEEEKKRAVDKANALDESIGSLSFQISSLALYETDTGDKTLKSWKKVAECSLEN